MEKIGIIAVLIIIIFILYEIRYYIMWFFNTAKVTFFNKKGIKDIQKIGMKKRNLTNKDINSYIKLSKEYLNKLGISTNRKFILNKELEMHLKYSRFSEKYVLELLNNILDYLNLDKENVSLKINYISSKQFLQYAGLYDETTNDFNQKQIVINIQNDMNLENIVSILAHESTHYLLLSNNIKIENRMQNECLTDITAILLGFGEFMVEGYKISNRVIYDEINHRSIKKDRIGYITYKDVKYARSKI